MWRKLVFVSGSFVLAACVQQPYAVLEGDLPSARAACNQHYPERVGNYLPHAHCVNAAIERFALPAARYPDLIRMQEEIRLALSDRVDRRRISPRTGARRMSDADRLVAAIERDRSTGNAAAANRRLASLNAILLE